MSAVIYLASLLGLSTLGPDEISAFPPDQVCGLGWPLTPLGFRKAGLTYFVINLSLTLANSEKSIFTHSYFICSLERYAQVHRPGEHPIRIGLVDPVYNASLRIFIPLLERFSLKQHNPSITSNFICQRNRGCIKTASCFFLLNPHAQSI